MAFDEYPEAPVSGKDADGNLQEISVDSEGKQEVTDQSAEGLLYSINENLITLIELIKGVVG